MNDVEKRRLQLLQETRKNYSDSYAPPAIHPRFESTYHSIYQQNERDFFVESSYFFLRIIIAALVFGLLFVMDVRDEKIGSIDSQTIINEVQKNLLGE